MIGGGGGLGECLGSVGRADRQAGRLSSCARHLAAQGGIGITYLAWPRGLFVIRSIGFLSAPHLASHMINQAADVWWRTERPGGKQYERKANKERKEATAR